MVSVWILSLALLGPGPDELVVPPPKIEPLTPIEGPARPPPVEGAEPPSEPESSSEVGIELALEPPDDELDPPTSEAEAPVEASSGSDPGLAPSDGNGLITSAAILAPAAALLTWQLLRTTNAPSDRVAIWVTGASFEVLAGAFIGTGFYRRAKLRRWTTAHRVIARPQGRGLLSAGGISLGLAVSLVGVGVARLVDDPTKVELGATMIGLGIVAAGGVAPPLIVIGKRRRDEYLATGGWTRRPRPSVELAPRLILGREAIGLGLSGRF